MAVIGKPRSFLKQFKFLVEIDRFSSAAFQSCSELSAEIAKVEQFEGGVITPEKDPGRVTFTDVTLERGATNDTDMLNWFEQVANASQNRGFVTPDFKRIVDIVAQDLDGTTRFRWRLFEAWPMKFVAGAWDNNSDDNVIESVTLTYRHFDRIAA